MTNYTHWIRRHSHNDPFVPLPHPQLRNWPSTATMVTNPVGAGVLTATKILGEKEHIRAQTVCINDLCR